MYPLVGFGKVDTTLGLSPGIKVEERWGTVLDTGECHKMFIVNRSKDKKNV